MNKITVRADSWHYRLHNFVWTMFDLEHERGPLAALRGQRSNHHPKSLCSYFWSTTLLVVFSPVWLVVVGAVCLIVLAVFVAAYPFMVLQERQDKARSAKGKPPKTSLVASFVKAKKARVCPLIEVQR